MEPIPRLGKRIQQLRQDKGISVQELAERAGQAIGESGGLTWAAEDPRLP